MYEQENREETKESGIAERYQGTYVEVIHQIGQPVRIAAFEALHAFLVLLCQILKLS